MTDIYEYGQKKKIVSDLCSRNPDWTSVDLSRRTGLQYSQVLSALRGLGVKTPPVLKTIAVDKGIPIPDISRGIGKRYNYPWKAMEVGDSFLYPPTVNYGTARGNVNTMEHKLGRKFALRTTPEGLRCWRIA